jgi:hypothetical protein
MPAKNPGKMVTISKRIVISSDDRSLVSRSAEWFFRPDSNAARLALPREIVTARLSRMCFNECQLTMPDIDSLLTCWHTAGVLDTSTADRIRAWEREQKRPAGLRWQGLVALILGAAEGSRRSRFS